VIGTLVLRIFLTLTLLCQLFNRTVALFKLTIENTPEPMIPVCTTTNAGYNFFVFSGLSILVLEVKYDLGNAEERLNSIAQVIAESDGKQPGFHRVVSSCLRTHISMHFSSRLLYHFELFGQACDL
jgi:hypothetical protein